MLCYCEKCGCITDLVESELNKGCYCCGHFPRKPIPREYIDNFRWRDGDGEEAFIEEVIKKSPNLDQYLFEHADEIIKQKNDIMEASIARGKAILEERSRVARCPSCGSTNTAKIGTVSRMIYTGLFGLASSKIGKTHKCNNCGTMW